MAPPLLCPGLCLLRDEFLRGPYPRYYDATFQATMLAWEQTPQNLINIYQESHDEFYVIPYPRYYDATFQATMLAGHVTHLIIY